MVPFLKPRQALAFALLVVLVLLVGNASASLWDQDEAAYAGFARTMLQDGDWVVPRFLWSEPHRKPPLLFWCIAASFRLFGESEFALRLPGALAVAATSLSIWSLGGPIFGDRARLAAAILPATLFVPNLAKVAVTDSLVMLFETLAGLAIAYTLLDPSWRWTALFWVCVSLGTLAKGPVLVIFSSGFFALVFLLHPQRRRLLALQPWFFLPLALLPTLIWGWLAWNRTGGELIRWMLDWYVLHRMTRAVFDQTGPPGYYLAGFLVTLLPWSMFLPGALVRVCRRWREPEHALLIGWLCSGWVVWEFAASKLPTYALGAYPALALLIAEEILDPDLSLRRSTLRWGSLAAVIAAAAVSAGMVAGAFLLFHEPVLTGLALAPAILLLCTPVIARIELARGRVPTALRVMLFGTPAVLLSAWLLVIPALEHWRGISRSIGQVVDTEAPPGARIILGGRFHKPSLPFYLGRTHSQLAAADEVESADLTRWSSEEGATVVVLDEEGHARLRDPAGWRSIRVDGFDFDHGVPSSFWVLIHAAGATFAAPR